jgi:hypothetical protein
MVDRTEIDQMAKFMAAMGDGEITPPDGTLPPSRAPSMVGDTNIAEMKLILERFHAAAGTMLSEAPSDRDLRDSLAMQLTETGVSYGGWEIVVKKNGGRSLYDVIHTATNEKIAADLMLYEAAIGLARHLNEDGFINSKQVLEMLRAELDYAGAVNDMVIYKHHLNKTPNSPRAPIYEARYGAAKRRAVTSRDHVYRIAERL